MRRRRHALFRLTLPLLFCGNAALAEDIPSAVGRISYGDAPAPGAAICTGVLVAPDLVLTAAHCVRGAAGDPSSIRFDARWRGGRPTVRGRGAQVVLPGSEEMAEDVALIVLQTPVAPGMALPLAAPSGALLAMQGFRRDAPDQPARPQTCRALVVLPGLLGLDCAAVSGNSGAALLQQTDGAWQVAAIMVAASSNGPVRSWAVLPPDWVQQRLAP